MNPNQSWVWRRDVAVSLRARRELVARRTAAYLQVPYSEVCVQEIPYEQGVQLIATWLPR